MYVSFMINTYELELTDCRAEHYTEADEYGKLVSNPGGGREGKEAMAMVSSQWYMTRSFSLKS